MELTDEQVDMVGKLGAMSISLHERIHSVELSCERCRIAHELVDMAANELHMRKIPVSSLERPEEVAEMVAVENLLKVTRRVIGRTKGNNG